MNVSSARPASAWRPGDLEEVAALAVKGVLPDGVTRRSPRDQAVRAYADLENGHVTGKLLITW
ncbi:hypothetical protein [Spongiactinospora gelatinilytica]|nr:hypothetical protein [Spongiactinospora gelatinilytica]